MHLLFTRPGVISAAVALLSASATVVVDKEVVTDEAVLQAVDDAGFDVSLRTALDKDDTPATRTKHTARVLLALPDVSTEAEAEAASLAALALPGVAAVQVKLHQLAWCADVAFDPHATGPRTLLEQLPSVGVHAQRAPTPPRADANGAYTSRDTSFRL